MLYSDEPPVVRAISPLAEGVDRMFAREAISTGCELTVVLPFPQAEFENDFQRESALEENSLEQFRGLIGKASTVFELDGCREDSPRAYHHAGTVVLNQSDLLVVVWDGERKNQRGGTEETFDDAVERGVPVIWINAQCAAPLADCDAADQKTGRNGFGTTHCIEEVPGSGGASILCQEETGTAFGPRRWRIAWRSLREP